MGKANIPNKADILEPKHEQQLWDCNVEGTIGLNDPESLLCTVWFHTTNMLGFRGCHEARQLKWGDFNPVYDDTPKQFPNNEDSCKCWVKAILTYKEHRPDSMLHHDAPFYIAKNYNQPNSSAALYKNNAMCHGRIGTIMSRMAFK